MVLPAAASGGLGTRGLDAARGEHRVMVEWFKFGIRPDERGNKGRGFTHSFVNVG